MCTCIITQDCFICLIATLDCFMRTKGARCKHVLKQSI